mmetsp:Transcript_56812/g.130469  ORF Transcript_56812/g.130469 Transcript_56812/m.130469 type:complete len:125 (+) Transcript_56812:974-1348(+)
MPLPSNVRNHGAFADEDRNLSFNLQCAASLRGVWDTEAALPTAAGLTVDGTLELLLQLTSSVALVEQYAASFPRALFPGPAKKRASQSSICRHLCDPREGQHRVRRPRMHVHRQHAPRAAMERT